MKTLKKICLKFYFILFIILTNISIGKSQSWYSISGVIDSSVTFIKEFNNRLYLFGNFDSIGNLPAKNLASWDGNSFTPLNMTINGTISKGVILNNKLIVIGNFTTINGIVVNRIAQMDTSGNWVPLGNGFDAIARDITIYNNEIYAVGYFKINGNAYYAAKWDGINWLGIGNIITPIGTIMAIEVFNNELYIGGYSEFRKWTGFSWVVVGGGMIPDFYGGDNIWSLHAYGSYLYVGGQFAGGGSINSYGFIKWDGNNWSAPGFSSFDFASRVLGYNGKLYMQGSCMQIICNQAAIWNGTNAVTYNFTSYSNFTTFNGDLYISCALNGNPVTLKKLCTMNDCSLITGSIYNDENSNCIFDSNDTLLTNRIIEITPGPYYSYADSNGNYSTLIPPGTYNVKCVPQLYWDINCPNNITNSYDINVLSGSAGNYNFGWNPNQIVQDLQINIAANTPHPGFIYNVAIQYKNVGTFPMNGNIELTYDPVLTFVSSIPLLNSQTSNVLSWNFTNLQYDEQHTIHISFQVPALPSLINSQLVLYTSINPIVGDETPINNVDSVVSIVSGSFDPNFKEVFPIGYGSLGDILLNDSVLKYTIHFQNTGNDTAKTVIIQDTISDYLDISTIFPNAASHPYEFNLSGQNIATWKFRNINLPDSTTNPIQSQGFLSYTIKQNESNSEGIIIRNKAQIYFDFNPAIATNSTVNRVVSTLGIKTNKTNNNITIFPNPSNGVFNIKFNEIKSDENYTILISDVDGKQLFKKVITDLTNITTVNLANQTKGVYILKVIDSSNIYVKKIIRQ
ncbi:MAG: T9SS type A sorting domain-containing protein [Bacteroidia bacterium]|nr:T9SS type A sorting domain-containing protein [Bacteroidia bacterium]